MSTCPRPVAAACPWPSFDTAIHQLWDPIRGAAPLPARVHSRPVSCIIRAHSHAPSFARKHEESIPSKIRGRCDNSQRCWGNSSRSTHRPAVFKQSEPGSCTLAQHRVPELRCRITGPKSRESSVRVGHGRTWSRVCEAEGTAVCGGRLRGQRASIMRVCTARERWLVNCQQEICPARGHSRAGVFPGLGTAGLAALRPAARKYSGARVSSG